MTVNMKLPPPTVTGTAIELVNIGGIKYIINGLNAIIKAIKPIRMKI